VNLSKAYDEFQRKKAQGQAKGQFKKAKAKPTIREMLDKYWGGKKT